MFFFTWDPPSMPICSSCSTEEHLIIIPTENIKAFTVQNATAHLYKVDLLKLRLRNLATCWRERQSMGITETAKNEIGNLCKFKGEEHQFQARYTKITKPNAWEILTFEAQTWSEKRNTIYWIDKIFSNYDCLKPHLQRRQVPCSGLLQKWLVVSGTSKYIID